MNVHERTEDIAARVLELAGKGASHRDIARATGIAANTLRKHYGDELKRGAAGANIAVGNRLFEAAVAGDLTAAIFFLKARAGWRDRPELPTEDEGRLLKFMRAGGYLAQDLLVTMKRHYETHIEGERTPGAAQVHANAEQIRQGAH
jgi:hypothetical protein